MVNVNSAYGTVYWVDENNGADTNTGLRPDLAFATIGAAITASNLTCGSYNMNTIYVNAQTYTESLTVPPKNVNIIGIGAKVRLAGNQTFAGTGQNCHFWNIQFRASSGTAVTIPSTTYGVGFHGCTFEGNGTATVGLSVGGTQDLMIEDCRFLGNPIYTTAIDITGACIRGVIKNNLITATTCGIQMAKLEAGIGYGNIVVNNDIWSITANPNGSSNMTYGISMLSQGTLNGWNLHGNRISAADGIYIAHTSGTQEQDCCVQNWITAAGTATWEDGGTID